VPEVFPEIAVKMLRSKAQAFLGKGKSNDLAVGAQPCPPRTRAAPACKVLMTKRRVRKVSMLFMSAELKQNQLNSTSCLVKKNLLNDSKTPAIMKCFCYSECCHACAVPRT
jgi:hypothetical protein